MSDSDERGDDKPRHAGSGGHGTSRRRRCKLIFTRLFIWVNYKPSPQIGANFTPYTEMR